MILWSVLLKDCYVAVNEPESLKLLKDFEK